MAVPRLTHDHPLDDKLHPGCPMCDYIETVKPSAAKQKMADDNTERFAKKARKGEHGN